jgi:SAM-dependent methyltransferase
MNRFHRWFCRSDLWRTAVQRDLMPWALSGLDLGNHLLEVGPGPGLTTDLLRTRVPQLTSIEIDPALADALKRRLAGSNVRVVHGDATRLPFEDGAFSAAVSFTMLHHVPSPALQNRLLGEVRRVLAPGGVFAGTDSVTSLPFRLMHLVDTMVMVDPDQLGARLEAAGFDQVSVRKAKTSFSFRAVAGAAPLHAAH